MNFTVNRIEVEQTALKNVPNQYLVPIILSAICRRICNIYVMLKSIAAETAYTRRFEADSPPDFCELRSASTKRRGGLHRFKLANECRELPGANTSGPLSKRAHAAGDPQ